ncbi:MAG: DUF4174 domain-containing protein [Paracoccus sp. (in: a-proteobacteria)]|nr:DUF4174 domain-containing protein [Paracoccus sp. (in: a-proteobacteria)]
MNAKAILFALAVLMAAPMALAMGNRTPDDIAEGPQWVRPGDVLAREQGANHHAPDTEAAGGGSQVFFDAADSVPEDWVWSARVIAVFADTPQDPAFRQQIRALEDGAALLAERGAVVVVDADPAAGSAWRRALRPEGFSLVLIDRDGTAMLRKPMPWNMREITRAIDRFPSRREEIGRGSVVP